MLDVRPEYLAAGFGEVQQEYGTFDTYLRQGLGLSRQDLRDLHGRLLTY
ncbi:MULTISPECIES: tyrosine-protein phosphatase [Kitasatospora]